MFDKFNKNNSTPETVESVNNPSNADGDIKESDKLLAQFFNDRMAKNGVSDLYKKEITQYNSRERILHPDKRDKDNMFVTAVASDSKSKAVSAKDETDYTAPDMPVWRDAQDATTAYQAYEFETPLEFDGVPLKIKRMRPHNHYSAIYTFVIVLIAFLVAQLMVSVIGTAMGADSKSATLNVIAMFTSSITILAVLALLCKFVLKRKRNFNYFTCRKTGKGIDAKTLLVPIGCAVLLFVGMYMFTTLFTMMITLTGISLDDFAVNFTNNTQIVFYVIAATIAAPIAEEVLFRGVLFHGINSRQPLKYSILISSLLFMLMHMNILQTTYQFALGALSAYLVYKSGRLICGIILHSVSNVMAVTLSLSSGLSSAAAAVDSFIFNNIGLCVFLAIVIMCAAFAALYFGIRFVFKRESFIGEEVIKARKESTFYAKYSMPRLISRTDKFYTNYSLVVNENRAKRLTKVVISALVVLLLINWIVLAVS